MQKINQETKYIQVTNYCFIRKHLNNLLQDLLISFTQFVNTLTAVTERFVIYPNLSLCRQYFSNWFITTQEHPYGIFTILL